MENHLLRNKFYRPLTATNSKALADVLDDRRDEGRSWFWEFLESILESPDYDISQFERIEKKRTMHQINLERWY